MKTEKITIDNKEYKLKIGFGVMMDFEEQTGKSITDISCKNDILKLAYTTLTYNNEDFTIKYKALIDDVLDENPTLFIELIGKITSLIFDTAEGSEGKKK